MELTHETRARIFGLYLGCAIIVNAGEHKGRYTFVLGLNKNGKVLTGEGKVIKGIDVQLLLSPLSSITDEECIECYNIDCDPRSVNGIKDDHKIAVVRTEIESGFVSSFAVADFLRSKYYALPYGEVKDLFEAGIAIDKTKKATV